MTRSVLRLWRLLLLAPLALGACAPAVSQPVSSPPVDDPDEAAETPEVDDLANRLLRAAILEAQVAIEAYEAVAGIAEETALDAQNRARQKVLEGALAAERGETLLRIRFAMVAGEPPEDEGQARVYLSFLATGADDLLEADAIDPVPLRRELPFLIDPLREVLDRLAPEAP
ncbi:MAG: hypothetical protein AAFQ43_11875 [Bacteroidota bacterium]